LDEYINKLIFILYYFYILYIMQNGIIGKNYHRKINVGKKSIEEMNKN